MTAVPVASLSYLMERVAGLPFLPFDIFDWLARILPGPLITAGIDTMVAVITALRLGPTSSTAKAAEQALALGLWLVGGGLFGLVLAAFARAGTSRLRRAALLGGGILWALAMVLEASLGFPGAAPLADALWLGLLLLGWAAALGRLIAIAGPALASEPAFPIGRRSFLYLTGGGVLSITFGSLVLAATQRRTVPSPTSSEEVPLGSAETSGPAVSPPQEVLAARIQPAPGTRPELTSNEDFYRIDINTRPPVVEESGWRLEVGGLVATPLSLSLAELRAMPSAGQVITLQCISNPVAGDLISTSRWTGVRFRDLLDRAGVLPQAREAFIESVDGFYESVSMEDMQDERTLLVYEMNGVPLPEEHGFPLRIYIPNRYGMKQPKWIQRIELIDREGAGYWVDRGWSAEARPRTVSAIDAIGEGEASTGQALVPVGGIAWAGARGISRVEVQVDDGAWVEAELRAPPLSPLTWVQWRFDWPFAAGAHTFRVRAYDAAGVPQISERNPTRPDGATGIHEVTVTL
jgi:DMSO/TMAO reductase YedYZ molybdopterin-dependent catalytic subunit